jgi:hypothetical protein
MNHIAFKIGGNPGPAAPKMAALWLNSAKGGDPMSHGPAERSVSFRTEHYR